MQLWPAPPIATDIAAEAGPILVTVACQVVDADQRAFAEAIQALGMLRRRDGALRWGVMSEAAVPERVVERLVVASWEEHLRQHERAVAADAAVQAAVQRYHAGGAPPIVQHLVPFGDGRSVAVPGAVNSSAEERGGL